MNYQLDHERHKKKMCRYIVSNLVSFCYSVDVADSVYQSDPVEVKRRRRGLLTKQKIFFDIYLNK